MKAVYILLDFYLEFSLNTCLQRTNVKKAMETRNEQFGQDGREHGWCSSKYPQGVAKAYLQCLFFLHMCSKNMIHSKAQRKRWPHAVQQKAAGWRRNLMQCFQIQSKWMRRPHTQNFNWRFLISEIGASTWTPLFKLRKHFPPHPHGLEHQNQTSKLKPSHVFTYYSLDSLDLFDLGLFWNQCLVSLWTARLTFWPRVYRVFVKSHKMWYLSFYLSQYCVQY